MIRKLLLLSASAVAFAAGSADAVTFVYTGTIQTYEVPTTGPL